MTTEAQRLRFNQTDRNTVSREKLLKEQEKRFGNYIWKSDPVEIENGAILDKESPQKLRFKFRNKHFPFNGDIPISFVPFLLPHVRSRYAHVGIDILDLAHDLQEAIEKYGIPQKDEDVLSVDLLVFNHLKRPVKIPSDAKIFHLYYTNNFLLYPLHKSHYYFYLLILYTALIQLHHHYL